jgi:hypothetical protein
MRDAPPISSVSRIHELPTIELSPNIASSDGGQKSPGFFDREWWVTLMDDRVAVRADWPKVGDWVNVV